MIEYSHENKSALVIKSNDGRKITFYYPCNSPFTCSPFTIQLTRGLYFLEVYGAQGGNRSIYGQSVQGGKGGYSSGLFSVVSNVQTLYLFIGATENAYANQQYDIFNGGGRGYGTNDGPGGGATDFRTIDGLYEDQSLFSRIIVAGGSGGGNEGEPGESNEGCIPCSGSQYSCINGKKVSQYYYEGTFGKGSGGHCGGGGGGYFGGGNTNSGGAGGSGYIGGVFGNPFYKKLSLNGKNNGFGWAQITSISIKHTCKESSIFQFIYIFIFVTIIL